MTDSDKSLQYVISEQHGENNFKFRVITALILQNICIYKNEEINIINNTKSLITTQKYRITNLDDTRDDRPPMIYRSNFI